eukprot:9485915-Pyramimonas_sp.AAC.1
MQIQSAFISDVVVRQRAHVLQLLASDRQTRHMAGEARAALHHRLHSFDGVESIDAQVDCVPLPRVDVDLHAHLGGG